MSLLELGMSCSFSLIHGFKCNTAQETSMSIHLQYVFTNNSCKCYLLVVFVKCLMSIEGEGSERSPHVFG